MELFILGYVLTYIFRDIDWSFNNQGIPGTGESE